jgi:hypothetical protein
MFARVLLPVLLMASPAFAASQCPPYREAIALDFQTLQPETRTDNTRNITAIRDLIRGAIPKGLDAHSEALGVTMTNPSFGLDARTWIAPQEGGSCVYLQKVTATFGFRSMAVYVASEYPPGTCEYNAILDHENQHVGIDRSALSTHAGLIRLELERILGEQKPVFTRDPHGATRDILNRIARQVDPALSAFYREIDTRNAIIDSQPNYDAIAEICRNWNRGTVWPQGHKP